MNMPFDIISLRFLLCVVQSKCGRICMRLRQQCSYEVNGMSSEYATTFD